MKTTRTLCLAIFSKRALAFAIVGIALIPQFAAGKSEVAVRKKFIRRSHNWESVRRIAILPIKMKAEEAVAPGENRKWTATRVFPPDSVVQPLVQELVRQIKHLDSSIVVMLIDRMEINAPQSMVLKIAGGATGANAVIEMTINDVEYLAAKPEAPAPIVNGARLPAIPGRPAATRVRMSFTMTDPRSSGSIWQVDLEGKESSGGPGGSPDEADPPSPEALIQELIINAGSWLPF